MAKTKVKQSIEPEGSEEKGTGVSPADEKADDQTAIDALEDKKKKTKKEKLPKGYKERLPAGIEREIGIDKDQIGIRGGKPYEISEDGGESVIATDKLRIEGESEFEHVPADVCISTTGRVRLKTSAPVLIGKRG